ncbi:hypothetical protein HYC85_029430 [Camellia sinensis]|uniref:Protein kinase domain-containing protein n=1 Tax=Camellia sinensis TaxID=4442 RepID=A0A7J7FY71_CAMSI|nr:hypothetical protein HYC85_029430 [Camellia sinensis]
MHVYGDDGGVAEEVDKHGVPESWGLWIWREQPEEVQVMASKTKIYIVLEYVGEGELFDKIPENMLLDSFGVLKVSDFGLSAFSQQVQVSIMKTYCFTLPVEHHIMLLLRCSLLKVMMVQQLMYGLVGSFCLFLWLDTYLLTSRTTWL